MNKKSIWRLNLAFHRDLGYFASALIIVYCVSGIALNHVDDWNPDFIIQKENITLGKSYTKADVNETVIQSFSQLVGESKYKVYDFPTENQVKIYYDNSSLHVHLNDGTALYEKISRRPVFYESNLFHRNSIRGWKWAADVFALILIVINATGLFILKGKYGLSGRGKWFILAGALPPVIALILFELL